MTHSRPVGVTLSAIVVILGSAAMVFFSIVMLISSLAVPANPQVPYMAVVSFVMVFFMLLMAGWGIATSIGLFQMRPWSRWSMLVFAGLMTFMSSITVLTTSVMPVPTVPDEAAGIVTAVRIALSLFYGVLALVGIAWLIYFGKRSTRDQFGGAYVPVSGGRPLSITIIGWYLIVSSAFMLVLVALPVPALLLVTVVHGPAAKVVYLVWLAVQLAIGFGLLKLKPWSWKAAIGLCAYGVLGMILSVAMPGLQAEVWEATSAFNTFPESPGVDLEATRAMQIPITIGTSLFFVIPVWLLFKNRSAFGKPAVEPAA